MSTNLLVLWALFSILACPILFMIGIDNRFGILSKRAWWWDEKKLNSNKALDILFISIPLLIGSHWLIVLIWLPNYYKQ